jgi:hypothetical protein
MRIIGYGISRFHLGLLQRINTFYFHRSSQIRKQLGVPETTSKALHNVSQNHCGGLRVI